MEVMRSPEQPNLSTLSLSRLIRPKVSGGKIALPVTQYSVYARFKHIETVPADGQGGYPLSKVRMLDALIDRLIKMKERDLAPASREELARLSDETIDAMIQEYSQRLSNAMSSGIGKLQSGFGVSFAAAGGAAPPAQTAGMAVPGAVLNLTA